MPWSPNNPRSRRRKHASAVLFKSVTIQIYSTNNKDFTTSKVRVAIPYSADLLKKIKNIYKSFGIATLYKPVTHIRYKLVLVKDNTSSDHGDKQYKLVYGFKCSGAGCDESYMGETKQPIKIFIHSKHSGLQS